VRRSCRWRGRPAHLRRLALAGRGGRALLLRYVWTWTAGAVNAWAGRASARRSTGRETDGRDGEMRAGGACE
jgi:hypothetical protein